MRKSILNDKWILVVNHQPLVLMGLEEEILRVAPNSHVDKATHYKDVIERIASFTYDLMILDCLDLQSLNLVSRAMDRFPPPRVILLVSGYLDSEDLNRFVKMKARIFSPKEDFKEIVPFLEDAIRRGHFSGWKHVLEDLTTLFSGSRTIHRIESVIR